ncbi:hypothetical protein O6H91_17G018200 [Diphasiastrum complanatum]|uniref:Uncharacterized protein n=1 Tax=Diphasiastrum complanatum TaxID=34168 RepID=A0ACC2B4M1_DIPCM|nr:hypothetical protein O6H91_17G018200 [Diphasiastrum complanatum]
MARGPHHKGVQTQKQHHHPPPPPPPSSRSQKLVSKLCFVAMAASAVLSLFRRLRMVLLTWAPSEEEELEGDRAGRIGELRVADIFQGIPGVRVFDSLRIPDTENKGRREIDLVLLTNRKIYVVEVKNWSGIIKLEPDGGWCQIRKNGTIQKHPNIVEETRYRAALLEAYLSRRGADLPPMCIDYKVFLVNSECRPEQAILMQPEVLTGVQWKYLLDQDLDRGYFTWLGPLYSTSKKGFLKASVYKQLQFILSTTPTWDRMWLEGGRIMVGDFLQFKGRAEDMEALKFVKRPTVSNLAMVHFRSLLPNLLGKRFVVSYLLCWSKAEKPIDPFFGPYKLNQPSCLSIKFDTVEHVSLKGSCRNFLLVLGKMNLVRSQVQLPSTSLSSSLDTTNF